MSDITVAITPPPAISATVGNAGEPIEVSVVEAAPIVVTVSNMPGADGAPGLPGAKGDPGDTGPPGSDATVTYSNVISALGGGGALTVRYDSSQPQVDCLWVAPTGQVVLITGS